MGEVVGGRLRGVRGGAFRVCLCRWCGGLLERLVAHVGSFGGGGFPHPFRVAHPFRFPFPLRARSFHPCSLRDTLKRNINH